MKRSRYMLKYKNQTIKETMNVYKVSAYFLFLFKFTLKSNAILSNWLHVVKNQRVEHLVHI